MGSIKSTKKIISVKFKKAKLLITVLLLTHLLVQSQTIIGGLSQTTRVIPVDMLGLNGTNTLVTGSTWGELQNLNPHPFCKMQLGNIRYPGGQLSNYWNWHRGWFLRPYEYPPNISINNSYDFTNALANTLADFKPNYDLLNAKPIWGMNPLTSTKEYQAGLLFAAKSNGFGVDNIELGNEFYLEYDQYLQAFPSAKSYILKMFDWSTYFKGIHLGTQYPFSSSKIAVVGAISNGNDPGRRRMWLQCILDEMDKDAVASASVDAITLHDYFGAGSAFFGGGSGVMTDVQAQCMINQAYTTTEDLYANEFAAIHNHGKEIWITEYNLYDRTPFSVHATWAHGLTIALKTLRYMEEPLVTKVCMHTMTGDGGWASFFNDANGLTSMPPFTAAQSPCNVNTKQGDLTATGNVFRMLAFALKNSTSGTRIDFNGASQLSGCNTSPIYPDVYGWRFDADDAEKVIVLNLSNTTKTINLSTCLQNNDLSMLCIFPSSPTASLCVPNDAVTSSPTACDLLETFNNTTVDLLQVVLPPYGIAVVRSKKNALVAQQLLAIL
nr:hypothetical protein [Bacteroidota bacterium]